MFILELTRLARRILLSKALLFDSHTDGIVKKSQSTKTAILNIELTHLECGVLLYKSSNLSSMSKGFLRKN